MMSILDLIIKQVTQNIGRFREYAWEKLRQEEREFFYKNLKDNFYKDYQGD